MAALANPSEIDRELAERSLVEFIQQGWRYADPSDYVHGWHIEAVCEHLEAVTRGEVRNLLLNIPPRHMKSLSAAVAWPAWTWALKRTTALSGPQTRFLFASYAQSLSIRDSVKCRRLMESPWYQGHWGERFTFTSDQNTKIRFDNDQGGYRLATSVDGSNTGEGGDVICVDDAHNVVEAESDKQREGVLDWWDGVMATRLNDPKTGAFVVIMQRVHERDLSGHILAREHGWHHLCLPAEYEAGHPTRWIRDPRKEDGELLWPERVGPDEIAKLKAKLGPYRAAGQLQQRPSPAGGVFFKEADLRWYDTLPARDTLRFYGASDYAVTEGGGDYTVHGVGGVDADDNLFIADWWRQQTDSAVWIEAFLDLVVKWQPLRWAEEAGQIKKSLDPFARKRMRERGVYCAREQFTSAVDKPTRARSIQARSQMGKLYLPRNAPWVEALVAELTIFPKGVNDDQVDVLSLFGRMLDRMVAGDGPKPDKPKRDRWDKAFDDDDDDSDSWKAV